MSTANISQEIKEKFPLHSAVWENDYRQLEEEIRVPQVGKTLSSSLHRSAATKQRFFARWSPWGDVKSLAVIELK